jgi:hypothetical protein
MTVITPVPFDSNLDARERQAPTLFAAWQGGDAAGVRTVWRHHPRFLDQDIAWPPGRLAGQAVRASSFDFADARLRSRSP